MKTTNAAAKEPLLRIARREDVTTPKAILIRALAILAALVVDALFIFFVTGLNPLKVYGVMFSGTFGNFMRFKWAVEELAKLLLIGIALAPAFKMRFWNVGAEGQVLIGALMTAIVMIQGESLPSIILFPLMFVAAMLGGAIWGVIPAIFKAKWDTNETLFTLMMNYIAIQLVSYYYNKWKGTASALGKLNKASQAGWFPAIFGQRFFINIIIVIILMVVMYLYLEKTKQGYEITVVGESQNTARYAGINVKSVIIRTMAISGLICGLCGCLTVAGQSQTISSNTAQGYGFTAIIVAWLAKFNTFYMAGISLFIIALENGTQLIADKYSSFSDSACDVVIGIMLFCIIGSEFFINYRLIFRKKEENV